jgi:FMN phosphatase YigB (HAD superfamily)
VPPIPFKPPAVIFDRDGTLASVKYCAPTTDNRQDWLNYNSALRFDAPVPIVVGLLRSIRPGVTRIMTSGRMSGNHPGDLRLRFAMQDWLYKHDLPIDLLYMRTGGDHRRDSVVKEEIYRQFIEPHFDVRYVVDDRPQVVELWRSLGLPVLAVTDPDILPPIAKEFD